MSNFSATRRSVALAWVAALAWSAMAAQICKARLDCPGNWDGDTVRVASNVVMLAESFGHCTPDSVDENWVPGRFDTISIMFVVDHSGSMGVMDPQGKRYEVVERLIDSLYERSPASEVGIVVFSNKLLFNYQTDPLFRQVLPDSGWHDAYVPLTRLNSQVGGVPAVDKLKWAIQRAASPADTTFGGNRRLVNSDTSATGRVFRYLGRDYASGDRGGTDISLAFEAARKAFLTATYGEEQQFVIFLSDGVAQSVDHEREPNLTDYMDGTGMPTTFTAYFINENKPIPSEIRDTMTVNIRNNGYSSRNQYTDVWKTSGSEDALFSRLLSFTVGSGLKVFSSSPKSLTINGVTTATFDDSLAHYNKPFVPLRGRYTTMDISYTWHWDYPLDRDESAAYTVVIEISDNPDSTVPTECWDQGTLQLLYLGDSVGSVDPDWATLEAHFRPSSEFTISDATIVVMNAAGTDSLVLTAGNYGTYFGTTFKRESGSPAADNILQNGQNDSVVVIYRNPAVPLDVVRMTVPVMPARGLTVSRADYVDRDADGYPDAIRVVQAAERLTAAECALIQAYVTVDTRRGVSVDTVLATATGFDIVLAEPPATERAFTGLYPGERLIIDKVTGLPGGGTFPYTSIAIGDSMAPVIVSASFTDLAPPDMHDTLRVVFSEDVKNVGSAQPFLFHREPDSAEYSFRVSLVGSNDSLAVFSVPPVAGRFEPRPGDSIRIGSSSGIADTLGTRQTNALNARRDLGYYKLYRVLSAAYSDTSAVPDGLIDAITVVMDQPPDAALLQALARTLVLPAYRHFSFDSSDIVRTANGFVVYVTQPDSTVPFTGVNAGDILTVNKTTSTSKGVINATTIPIADNMAPVVVSARFSPAVVENEAAPPPDTIRVLFSEPVETIKPGYPLKFKDVAGGEYVMHLTPLSHQGATVTFLVDTVEGKDFPQTGDLVWINPAAAITDTSVAGNVQTRENGPATLTADPYRYRFVARAWPNPVDPDNTVVPPDVIALTGVGPSRGVLVLVTPTGVVATHVRLSASMVIYDVVGNVIARLDASVDARKTMIAFVWDGKNENGRLVGSGTYYGVIDIFDSQNISEVAEVRIAVRR